MASAESPSGVAATMKADKANRESLAKKKSAVKADLERVTAELEEVEQMKTDAEDLEDEELLAEMLAEEQRLQVSLDLPQAIIQFTQPCLEEALHFTMSTPCMYSSSCCLFRVSSSSIQLNSQAFRRLVRQLHKPYGSA